MHPVLNHGYFHGFILSSLVFISTFLLSSGSYTVNGLELGAQFQNHTESVISNDYENGTFHHIRISSLSSWNNLVSCEALKGVGSLNTTCLLNSSLHIEDDLYIHGSGNLQILPHISIYCPIKGCFLSFNLSGKVFVGQYASLVAGSVVVYATNLYLDHYLSINTTALGGLPPAQTGGTPIGHDGSGGGHGGRGASCLNKNRTNVWGGDVYGWSTLFEPWNYGSKGASASADEEFGGNGQGCVMFKVKDVIYIAGSVSAEGGDGGTRGGGGSGGSIVINALKLCPRISPD